MSERERVRERERRRHSASLKATTLTSIFAGRKEHQGKGAKQGATNGGIW